MLGGETSCSREPHLAGCSWRRCWLPASTSFTPRNRPSHPRFRSSGSVNWRGGGGGSGGSVKLSAHYLHLGDNRVTAVGGAGGYGIHDNGRDLSGGAGGNGRIRLDYVYTPEGSTNPPAYVHQIPVPPTATPTPTPAPTPTPTPPDTEDPVVYWTAPVENEHVHHVKDEIVLLEVSATDNRAVSKVQFYRWDAVRERYVDIGEDTTSPYQMTLDCSVLNEGWNQINATAHDEAGNVSHSRHMWLYRLPMGNPIYLPVVLKDVVP